jgi:anti-anti-sigma factor
MEIITEKGKECAVVSVKGKIDAVTSPDFEKALADQIEKGETSLLLDFASVDYISSAGLRSILAIAKALKAKNGKMVFAGLRGPVKEVFKISGFESLFKIFETTEEALKSL